MTYYTPTEIAQVKEMAKELIADGFNTSISYVKANVIRKTSKYNKYIKWFTETFVDECMVSSEGFKTKKAAFKNLTRSRRPFPIGDRMTLTHIEINDLT